MEKSSLGPRVGLAGWARGPFSQGVSVLGEALPGRAFITALSTVGQLLFAGHVVGEWNG